MSYRNCCYRNKHIHLFTWDGDGNRVKYELPFEPYLYIEDPRGEKTSIFGTKVKKRSFKTSYDRSQYVKSAGTKRFFENLSSTQQFLIDNYWLDNEKPEFTQHPLRISYFDIECNVYDYKDGNLIKCKAKSGEASAREIKLGEYRLKKLFETHDIYDCESKEWVDYSKSCYAIKTSFPSVDDPQHEINVITCHDSFNKKKTTFGWRELDKPIDGVDYVYCKTERDLLRKFLDFIQDTQPDILSGFNSEGFDIPYTVRRIDKVLGEGTSKSLSPLDNVYFNTFDGKFGQEAIRYYIDGISCLDYLEVYRRFCLEPRESYKLDALAEHELKAAKVKYGNINLGMLADYDWQKFVEYNVQDVDLIVRLEEKLRYIELLRMLAYTGLTTLEGAMGTIGTITGALTIKARKRNEVISTFVRGNETGKNPGAYVAEPKQGFQENIVSFDANSLYPNIMISLNLSPETKVGKIEKQGDNVLVRHVSGRTIELTKEKFRQFIDTEQLSITKANLLFSQKKEGIIPEFLNYQLQSRIRDKNEMIEKKKQLAALKKSNSKDKELMKSLELDIGRLHSSQLVKKILANATYGFLGNKHASLGDDDIAISVTLTGQDVIKQAGELMKSFLITEFGIKDQESIDNAWIYSDTDSCYFSLKCIKNIVPLKNDKGEISEDFYNLIKRVEKYLNEGIQAWSKRALRVKKSTLVFKRECIGDIGIFLEKKRYVIHSLDEEGVVAEKFKYTGVDVVRSTMPNAIKPYGKKIIETMLMTQSMAETNKVVTEVFDIFKKLSLQEIAQVSGIKKYEGYAQRCNEFNIGKGVPHHVKAAYLYNLLIEKLGLLGKYEKIQSGDKMRFISIHKPNKYNIEKIGFKYDFPEEFNDLFKINYEVMFDKILFSMISRFYTILKWQVRKPTESVVTELFDLFG